MTHVAIAAEWLARHPDAVGDVGAFLDGTVEPDLAGDKEKSHFGCREFTGDIVARNSKKVGVGKFLSTHSVKSDYERGVLLHLLTDEEYYTKLLPNDIIRTRGWDEYANDVVYTWYLYELGLFEQYGAWLSRAREGERVRELCHKWRASDEARFANKPATMLYTKADLMAFIAKMAGADIDKLARV